MDNKYKNMSIISLACSISITVILIICMIVNCIKKRLNKLVINHIMQFY